MLDRRKELEELVGNEKRKVEVFKELHRKRRQDRIANLQKAQDAVQEDQTLRQDLLKEQMRTSRALQAATQKSVHTPNSDANIDGALAATWEVLFL